MMELSLFVLRVAHYHPVKLSRRCQLASASGGATGSASGLVKLCHLRGLPPLSRSQILTHFTFQTLLNTLPVVVSHVYCNILVTKVESCVERPHPTDLCFFAKQYRQ